SVYLARKAASARENASRRSDMESESIALAGEGRGTSGTRARGREGGTGGHGGRWRRSGARTGSDELPSARPPPASRARPSIPRAADADPREATPPGGRRTPSCLSREPIAA